jgi:hypothetical protein
MTMGPAFRAAWVAFGAAAMMTGCSAPQPVVPDGRTRMPVNSDARIEAFTARAAAARRSATEEVRWTQEVQALKAELAQLRAATIVLAADAEGKSQSPLARAAAARLASGQPSMTQALQDPSPGTALARPTRHLVPAATSGFPETQDTASIQAVAIDAGAALPVRLLPSSAAPARPEVVPDSATTLSTTRPATETTAPKVPEQQSSQTPPALPRVTIQTAPPAKTGAKPDRVPAPEADVPLAAASPTLIRTTLTPELAAPTPQVTTPVVAPAARSVPMPTAFRSEELALDRRAPTPLPARVPEPPARKAVQSDAERQFRVAMPAHAAIFMPAQDSAVALVLTARLAERVVIRSRPGAQSEAERARQYLIGQGVPSDRIWIASAGPGDPTGPELLITVTAAPNAGNAPSESNDAAAVVTRR